MNAICERLAGTLRREVLDRTLILRREVPGQLLIVSECHLHAVLTEYLRHYNTARPHRALDQLAPVRAENVV